MRIVWSCERAVKCLKASITFYVLKSLGYCLIMIYSQFRWRIFLGDDLNQGWGNCLVDWPKWGSKFDWWAVQKVQKKKKLHIHMPCNSVCWAWLEIPVGRIWPTGHSSPRSNVTIQHDLQRARKVSCQTTSSFPNIAWVVRRVKGLNAVWSGIMGLLMLLCNWP